MDSLRALSLAAAALSDAARMLANSRDPERAAMAPEARAARDHIIHLRDVAQISQSALHPIKSAISNHKSETPHEPRPETNPH